jgi:hypothetical protein
MAIVVPGFLQESLEIKIESIPLNQNKNPVNPVK